MQELQTWAEDIVTRNLQHAMQTEGFKLLAASANGNECVNRLLKQAADLIAQLQQAADAAAALQQ
jgi:hypothetical protein